MEGFMLKGCAHLSLAGIFAGLFFLPLCIGQQGAGGSGPSPQEKALTPAQRAYRQYKERRTGLRAKGKDVFDAEMAREKAGDCKDANNQAEFNVCFGKVLTITERNLDSMEQVIRGLQAGVPKTTEEAAQLPTGHAGAEPSPQQLAAQFDGVEKAWRGYREVACEAAFNQFYGGSGAPSFQMECELKLTRDHMRELWMIYGEDLYM
jgi:uncharacterized protein YecT (DUF1311 family)